MFTFWHFSRCYFSQSYEKYIFYNKILYFTNIAKVVYCEDQRNRTNIPSMLSFLLILQTINKIICRGTFWDLLWETRGKLFVVSR